MKKPILIAVAALLTIGIGTTAFAADINVNVENKKVIWTDAKPFIKDGRTLVPLRPIAEAMDLEVNWYPSLNQAYFGDGDEIVKFTLNSKSYEYQNLKGVNETKAMDVAAISVDGRIYAPARYLAEAFGYNVGWNGNTSTVTISKGAVETVIPTPKPAAPTNMELDPLPTMHYTKHPDWYMEVTPAHEMSDDRLLAEYNNLNQYMKTMDESTLPTLVREDDLWKQIMIRRLEDRFYDLYDL